MSNRSEAKRWLVQAKADLAAARHNRAAGHHEAAYIHAQRSGEKAFKGVLFPGGRRPSSHSLVEPRRAR